jgi:two-component system OmpR family response regulator
MESDGAQERIVVVGNPTPELETVVDALRVRGWSVFGPYGEDRVEDANQLADCAIVDVSHGDGKLRQELATLCRALSVHVLVITAQSDVKSRIAALRLGASDHCVAPFATEEVVARVEVLLARRRVLRRDRLTVGDTSVFLSDRRVVRGGNEINLTRREFEVLVILMTAGGRTVSKEQILREVWDANGRNVNLVEAHVSALRRKIEDAGPPVIRTVHGQGYAFVANQPRAPLTREALLVERTRLLRERDEALHRRDELLQKLRRQMPRS